MTTNTQQLAGLLQRVEGGSADLHPDDAAVDCFAEALKAKLACSRAKGRGGWDNAEVCSVEDLARMLIEHLDKGNAGTFEDVATFAMMLHQRGAEPTVLADAIQARDAEAKREGWADMRRIAKREIKRLLTKPSMNPPAELAGITAQLKEDHGFWDSCSGCHETEDGHPVGQYPYSEIMGCALGSGCSECGGIGAVWENNDYDYTPACSACLDTGVWDLDTESGVATRLPCPHCPCELDDDLATSPEGAE